MQLVASALAWQNLYLFSPKDPGSSHILQVCSAWMLMVTLPISNVIAQMYSHFCLVASQ